MSFINTSSHKNQCSSHIYQLASSVNQMKQTKMGSVLINQKKTDNVPQEIKKTTKRKDIQAKNLKKKSKRLKGK